MNALKNSINDFETSFNSLGDEIIKLNDFIDNLCAIHECDVDSNLDNDLYVHSNCDTTCSNSVNDLHNEEDREHCDINKNVSIVYSLYYLDENNKKVCKKVNHETYIVIMNIINCPKQIPEENKVPDNIKTTRNCCFPFL